MTNKLSNGLVKLSEAENTFEECKKDLANATFLAHPIPNANLFLDVDASNFSVCAVLHHLNNENEMEPLGFYSKRMTDTQKKYSTYDGELLAIYQAVKYFKLMIEKRQCTILTDHEPIMN